jgi:hypothetical protein
MKKFNETICQLLMEARILKQEKKILKIIINEENEE